MTRLILASTSRYRRELLARLGLAFECMAPAVDETARPGESPLALCQRLAIAKAEDIAGRFPEALVIGSDQVAECRGAILGKPGTRERAREQLLAASGRSVVFHTGIAVLRGHPAYRGLACDRTEVRFDRLDPERIDQYLDREPALDCAGSFKAEGLGIALFDSIHSHDPTALIGLPLIALHKLLRQAGIDPLHPTPPA
ncbi:MAG: nucleoside triphosphate pyrophosphatase [Porticoccaceae bacterium]